MGLPQRLRCRDGELRLTGQPQPVRARPVRRAGPSAPADTRATVAPGTSDVPRSGADSGRALNSSARAGTAPTLTGR